MSVPTEIGTAAEVLLATDHDVFARSTLRRPLVQGWSMDGAVLWLGVDADDTRTHLNGLGDPPAVSALLAAVLPELPHRQRVTLPRGTARLLPAWVGVDGTDWDFRWTPEPCLRQPREDEAVVLPDTARTTAQVSALLAAASPRANALPDDPRVRRWVGIADGDRLVACAADTSGATGVGHLSSVAVHPDLRGAGLGRAVTAALTRLLFAEGADVVTLGLYADNDGGRALYDALGWRDGHRFTSGPLQVRSRW